MSDIIPPVASLDTKEESYLPNDLDAFAPFVSDSDSDDYERKPVEQPRSKKEQREERMRMAFERSRSTYTADGAYTEAGWYSGLRSHPHDFDTLRDDSADQKSVTGSEATDAGGDITGTNEAKLDMRMVDLNLTNLYHKKDHLPCLALILPLLQIHIPPSIHGILITALHLAYPSSASSPDASNLQEDLARLGEEEMGGRDNASAKGLVEMGLRSGVKVLDGHGRWRPSEHRMKDDNTSNGERQITKGPSLNEAEEEGLRSVLMELAARGRNMGRKSGNGALAEAAGKMYMRLDKSREATICFLTAVADRGLCRPYLVGLIIALKTCLTANQDCGETAASADSKAEHLDDQVRAVDVLLENVVFLEKSTEAEAVPFFASPAPVAGGTVTPPSHRLTPDMTTHISSFLLSPSEVEEDDAVALMKDREMVDKVCTKVGGWVINRIARGSGEAEEVDLGRSVRTL